MSLLKKLGKPRGGPPPFDPKKPRAVRVFGRNVLPRLARPRPCRAGFSDDMASLDGQGRRVEGVRVADGTWAEQG